MKDMINKSIQEAFTRTNPKMVELWSQMLCQVGLQVPGSQALGLGSSTRGLHRYLVDDIVQPRECTLMIPFGCKLLRKKEVAMGVTLPLESGALYNNNLIPPNYARVTMTWTHNDYEEEIDIPNKEGKGTSEVFLA
jgi:hypothetical protein